MIAVFSDLHLTTDEQSPANQCFYKTLRSLAGQNLQELWLLGDTFDLLVAPKSFWTSVYPEFFSCLDLLHKNGCKITWVEGNHDFHLEALLRPYKVHYETEDTTRIIAGLKVYLGHGDTINTEDLAYLKWRRVIKSAWFRAFLDALPNGLSRSLCLPLAQRASRQSRQKTGQRDLTEPAKIYKKFYTDLLTTQGYAAVFLGHHHEHELQQIGEGFYLNLGCWTRQQGRYALWSPGELPQVVTLSF